MGKKITILILVLVILGVGFYLYNKKETEAPIVTENETLDQTNTGNSQTTNETVTTPTTTSGTQTKGTGTTGSGSSQGQFTNGGETPGSDIQVIEVTFDGKSFSPSSITVHQNDYVFFKNASTVNFWPASNPHPVHTIYPEFDADKAIGPGGQYKFQFTKIGTWGYHDHLHPSATGTVIVEK